MEENLFPSLRKGFFSFTKHWGKHPTESKGKIHAAFYQDDLTGE